MNFVCYQLFKLNMFKEAEVETGTGEEQIKEYSDKMDVLQSTGPDGVHPGVLKALSEAISEPLAIIFKNSCRREEVPEDKRRANTVY